VATGNDALVTTRVPFLLLLDQPFALDVPVADLLGAAVGDDEVLPIDLHVAIDRLFSAAELSTLEAVARTQPSQAVVLHASDTTAVGITVRAEGVRRAAESMTGGGIRVVGDLR
jgi:hypothetical protein